MHSYFYNFAKISFKVKQTDRQTDIDNQTGEKTDKHLDNILADRHTRNYSVTLYLKLSVNKCVTIFFNCFRSLVAS